MVRLCHSANYCLYQYWSGCLAYDSAGRRWINIISEIDTSKQMYRLVNGTIATLVLYFRNQAVLMLNEFCAFWHLETCPVVIRIWLFPCDTQWIGCQYIVSVDFAVVLLRKIGVSRNCRVLYQLSIFVICRKLLLLLSLSLLLFLSLLLYHYHYNHHYYYYYHHNHHYNHYYYHHYDYHYHNQYHFHFYYYHYNYHYCYCYYHYHNHINWLMQLKYTDQPIVEPISITFCTRKCDVIM